MTRPSEELLISTYRRIVEKNGGRRIGERVFVRETGFSHHLWKGGYWRSWSDFQQAAGFAPNAATEKIPDELILRRLAELTIERGSFPTEADLMLKRKDDPTFPSKAAYRRYGNRNSLREKLREFCFQNVELSAVLDILDDDVDEEFLRQARGRLVRGFVYLIRSGKSYKIGRSNAAGRRLRELSIQLPQKPDTVHVIETDDPEGIEQYWHRRFAEKRQGGEWFVLTPDDVQAFKARRYQ
jgi:hypothetical protein